jgi:hypothetical protein
MYVSTAVYLLFFNGGWKFVSEFISGARNVGDASIKFVFGVFIFVSLS